ncbi:hypothetical protein [Woeseia oceani]|nr:hypothetical protein [Woeseia oceani]
MKQESRTETLKNEATRQRWELFHRAIAHAKQSNISSLEQDEKTAAEENAPVPLYPAAS